MIRDSKDRSTPLHMNKNVIEIASDDITLSTNRGFLCIENNESGTSRKVPLTDILSLVISSNRVLLSKNAINSITEQDGVIICCGKNYMPASITFPYAAHWQNGERVRKQIAASAPLQKTLWKSLIQTKINNQTLVLKWLHPDSNKIERLKQLGKTVRSGDTGNHESIAAQIYFKAVFGRDFVRERQSEDINLLLNYIYIVLRACVARAIAGAGLLPALGIMHTNKLNPFALVDDVIEPYRPLADAIVFQLVQDLGIQDSYSLTPDIKRHLVGITAVNLESAKGQRPLATSLCDTANRLAKSYVEKQNLLEIDSYISRDELLR